MNSDAERTLNNLHVLASVSHNDKLMTNEDMFGIYEPTSMRGLMRMWYGERRGQNVQRVRHTVRSGMAYAQQYLDESAHISTAPGPMPTARLRGDTVALQHVRMVDALRASLGGLTNMLQTYREDAALTSQISGLVQEVTDFLTVLDPYSRPVRERCAGASPPASVAPPASPQSALSPSPPRPASPTSSPPPPSPVSERRSDAPSE